VPPSLRSRQPETNDIMTVYVNPDASYTLPGTLPFIIEFCNSNTSH